MDFYFILAQVLHDLTMKSKKKRNPSKVGQQQAYELGRFLRWRYSNLIGASYSPEKVYFRSTDRERTLMSAEWCAAGLFSSPAVNWLTEIHRIATAQDYLLYPRTKCARFSKLFDEHLESRKVVDIWKKHRPLIEFIRKNSGKRLSRFSGIADIYDILYVEDLKGFS